MIEFFRPATVTVLTLLLAASAPAVEMTWTYAVQASASVELAPARIHLSWTSDPFPISSYTVHRKAIADTVWSEGVWLGGDATGFTDENVEAGQVYEYQIVKHGPSYTGYGYIAVGVAAPLVDDRGRAILIVDDVFRDPLAGELARLQSDLAGDGWTVVRHDVSRSAHPVEIKELIRKAHAADAARTRAVFLLGRIPVVRSGNLNVDGHGARPMPADVFYGELDGEWLDANGDGIYDPNTLPSDMELQVGRVDFADLPGRFSPVPYPGEVELMKRYLEKNHAFRHAAVRPKTRAVIGNPIGDGNGQAYAASGYRNFAALVGAGNIVTADSEPFARTEDRWISLVTADDALWTFAGGAGSDFTIGGVGTHPPYNDLWASDFIEKNAKVTFYLLFGSWFSDWTKPDNILRTALATPERGLAAAWSGRPHLFFHHMGVGETIGYGIRASQNNSSLYSNQVQRQLRGVHIALMGDPTLRMQQLAPPRDLTLGVEGGGVTLSWKASSDEVPGYHIYRGPSADGPFTRLSGDLMTDLRFTDAQPLGQAAIYMVRAVALHSGPSGSFYNASQGGFAAIGAEASAQFETSSDATKASDIAWIDDALPPGAEGYAELDRWNWVTENPAPFSGARAHQADIGPGRHHHFFAFASEPLAVGPGDTLFAYVYLDSNNPPRQIMLTWLSDHWEHRAYWGENLIEEGISGSEGRRPIGPLPPVGRWVRLELSASAVGMENQTATGMGFTLFDGRVTWDRAGKSRP